MRDYWALGNPQFYINGVVHWVAKHQRNNVWCKFILTFDICDEVFREISFPQGWNHSFGWFDKVYVITGGESLTVVHQFGRSDSLDIWAMKEYGVPESRIKVCCLSLLPEWQLEGPRALLAFRKDGTILLQTDGGRGELISLISYEQRLLNLEIKGTDLSFADYYVERLFLLDETKGVASY
ncbi:F-box protein family [Quillaja saponaria]|uniref:F-box protein family n=1 Tax=Quillaja saponaria TaxID=32244 RepID=A0AAD7LLY1_QUISA|nr:F-box protein family [Quillaja saponaria]